MAVADPPVDTISYPRSARPCVAGNARCVAGNAKFRVHTLDVSSIIARNQMGEGQKEVTQSHSPGEPCPAQRMEIHVLTFRASQCAWQTAPHNSARLAPVFVVAAELGWVPQCLIHNPKPSSSPPTLARASRPVLSDTEIRALPLEPPAAAMTTTAPPAAARVLVLRDACCCLHRGAGGL